MYDTVIFDLDGTLMDTLDDLTDSVNVILEKYGYPKRRREEVRKFLGNGLLRTLRLSLPEHTPEETVNRLFPELKEYYSTHCQIKTKPYAGVADCMKKLKERGFKMAVVSNKNDAAVKTLNREFFSDYISVAIGEKPGIRKKPEPDTVYQALKELQSEKENAIYVGDSEVDKATADNAGIACISVDWGFRDREELEKLHPAYLISRPEEIPGILEMPLC